MKKKIFIGIIVLMLIFLGAGYMYLDSILTKIVLSTLDSQYGLRVEMSDLQLGATPGWVTIENPEVYDAKISSQQTLAKAGSISLGVNTGKLFNGEVDVQEIQTSGLAVDLVESASKQLNWSDVIPRFLPKTQTIAAAQAPAEPDKSSPKQTPVPPVTFENFQINFYPNTGEDSQSYNIKFGELEHDRDNHSVSIKELSASQNNVLLSRIQSANVENLFLADGSPINAEISGILLQAEETGSGHYNCNDVMNAWLRVYEEIAGLIPATTNEEKAQTELPLGKFVFTDAEVNAKPVQAAADTETSVNLKFQRMEYDHRTGGIVISGLDLTEAGQPAVHLDGMSLVYDFKDKTVRSVDIQGVRVDVREDSEGQFNLNRAIERIQGLIDALIPKDAAQTAQASPTKAIAIEKGKLNNAVIAFHSRDDRSHQMKLGGLEFSNENNIINVKSFSMNGADGQSYLTLPAVKALPMKGSNFSKWDSLTVDGLQSNIAMNADGMDIQPYIADWIALATSFSPQPKSSSQDNITMPFRSVQLTKADIHFLDNRLSPAMTHHITPLNLNWAQKQNNIASVSVTLNIASPGKGYFSFEGEGSQELYPITLSGKPLLRLENITAYQPFYAGKLPVTIEKSGMRLDGDLKITKNYLDSSINLYLLQPEFSVATGNLPVKVDSRAVVSTLNTLKDRNNVIVFKQNKISGEIMQPQFSFGTSIANILTTVIMKKGLDIITLPKDMAEGGVDVIKKGAGAVGDILGGILKQKK